MLYDDAIADFDRYYTLLNAQVNDLFFYYREQAKFRKGDYVSALDDIKQALRLAPSNPIYMAEEAAIYIRLEDYDSAINSLQKAIEQSPELADSHRLLGVCQVRKGNTAAACQSFHKAKELGDTVVDRLIQQYCGN
ncbi:tetratricopeptide repeat protein [Parabacteroides sp. OttesenSCG-928-G21]|nr:tetratricopeptide repeat protein [Parabacteroides sp. OttesenSCG-928-G21]